MFAAEPPLTSTLAALAGQPIQRLNHSRTTSSRRLGPAASIHVPTYGLSALARKSPSAAGNVPHAGMKAK
jgi:hypothetical protein